MVLKIGFHPPVADAVALQGIDLRFFWIGMHLSVGRRSKVAVEHLPARQEL